MTNLTYAQTVPWKDSWRTPGCGTGCFPRMHDPRRHEEYGRQCGREEALVAMRPRVVQTGPLVIDLERRVVTVNGEEITCSDREWRLLAYLAERPGAWCRSDDLMRPALAPNQVDVHQLTMVVFRLKRKLGPAAHLIEKVGRGGPHTYVRRRLRMKPTHD